MGNFHIASVIIFKEPLRFLFRISNFSFRCSFNRNSKKNAKVKTKNKCSVVEISQFILQRPTTASWKKLFMKYQKGQIVKSQLFRNLIIQPWICSRFKNSLTHKYWFFA